MALSAAGIVCNTTSDGWQKHDGPGQYRYQLPVALLILLVGAACLWTLTRYRPQFELGSVTDEDITTSRLVSSATLFRFRCAVALWSAALVIYIVVANPPAEAITYTLWNFTMLRRVLHHL